tara:strand:+ start:625 stop:2064 length:1440 start_codon:yes stop_codon:yes gene_type:complete
MAIRNYDIGGMLARSGQSIGQQISQGVDRFGQGIGGLMTGVGTGIEERGARIAKEKTAEEVQQLLQQNANNPAQLNSLGQKYASEGNTDMAQLFYDAATKSVSSVRQGVLGAAYQAGLEGKPIDMLQGELSTFTSSNVGGQASSFIEMYEKGASTAKGKDTKFGTTVTEWVNPQAPNKVVLKTLQREGSPYPIKLGSTTPIMAEDLQGLVKRQGKPGVTVNTGDKAEGAYQTELLKGIAEQDLKILEDGAAAETNLGTISEAKLVLNEPGNDVLGFGAETVKDIKSATLSLMGAFGVTEDDPLYKELNEATAAADLYNMFTQQFVKVRMEATKGAITEREFATFIASVPNLLQTAEGYKQVLLTMERANTAAVLKAKHVENNMGSQVSIKEARNEWTAFSNKFPLGSLSSEAMSTVWSEFTKPDFKPQDLVFSYVDEKTNERVQATLGEISRAARRNGIAPTVALKRLFSRRSAQHVQP